MRNRIRYANSMAIHGMNVNYVIVVRDFALFDFYPTAKATIRFKDFKITKKRMCMFADVFSRLGVSKTTSKCWPVSDLGENRPWRRSIGD